jgi:hypothetical protein
MIPKMDAAPSSSEVRRTVAIDFLFLDLSAAGDDPRERPRCRRRAARPELPGGAAGDLEEREVGSSGEPASGTLRRELAACLGPLIERLPD